MYKNRKLLVLVVFTALKTTTDAFVPATGRMVSHRLLTEESYSFETVKKSKVIRFATDISTKDVDVPEPEQKSLLQKVSAASFCVLDIILSCVHMK